MLSTTHACPEAKNRLIKDLNKIAIDRDRLDVLKKSQLTFFRWWVKKWKFL